MSERERQVYIDSCMRLITDRERTREVRRAANLLMAELIAERPVTAVARLERERGLAQ